MTLLQSSSTPASSRPAAVSPIVAMGRLFFRIRGWIYLPFAIFALVCTAAEWEDRAMVWPLGLTVMAAGAALRFQCIRYMGGAARTHKHKAKRLVTAGPYAWTRNPLYVANVTAFLGFVLLCELAWFVPVAAALLFAWYHAIARYEETILEEHFGAEFAAYRARTPLWLPMPPRSPGKADFALYPVIRVLRRERGALLNLLVMIALAAGKEFLFHPV